MDTLRELFKSLSDLWATALIALGEVPWSDLLSNHWIQGLTVVGILIGIIANWDKAKDKLRYWVFGQKPADPIQKGIEDLKAQLEKLQSGGSPGQPASASSDGLARDLNAGIETLLKAGKAEALKDKSGASAQAALDALIAERSTARERIAKDEAELWKQKGAFAFLHDTTAALAAYAKATEVDPDDVEGWNQLGQLYARTGDLDDAIAAFERVLALGNRSADGATIAAATGNLGLIYRTRGDLDRAEEMHRKSLALFEQLGRKEGMAAQYGNLGLIYRTRGDLDRAEEMHRKSLALEEQLGRKEGLARQYGNLGLIYQTRGDLDRAKEMHRMALVLNEQLGRKEGMANQYGNLGVIYFASGDLARAEQMQRKALALDEQLGNKEGLASTYGNLGAIYQTRGDLAAACAHWTKARDLFRQVGMKPQIAQTEANMRDAGCPGAPPAA